MSKTYDYGTYRGRLILRDHLANCRTSMANERTFLAYVRTALTLVVAGLTFIKFFDSLTIEIVGWVFWPVGVATFLVGLWRFRQGEVTIGRMNRAEAALKAELAVHADAPAKQAGQGDE